VIVGGPQEDALLVVKVFRAAQATEITYHITDARTAEYTKYLENWWLAQQVVWANEAYEIARAVGADWECAYMLWALDPRISPNHTIVYKDDRGAGGRCLPKDLAAAIAFSARRAMNRPFWLLCRTPTRGSDASRSAASYPRSLRARCLGRRSGRCVGSPLA